MSHGIQIEITYNGVTKPFEVQPEEQVQAVLSRAIAAFGVQRQPHQMGLFSSANAAILANESVEQAGIHAGDLLTLRQTVIEGGVR